MWSALLWQWGYQEGFHRPAKRAHFVQISKGLKKVQSKGYPREGIREYKSHVFRWQQVTLRAHCSLFPYRVCVAGIWNDFLNKY